MLKDVLIFQKIKNGDIRAFESLFRQYYEPLCHYSCKWLNNMDAAEETVQELFYKLWKDREQIHIQLSIKSYLYGAVRNNSLLQLEHLRIRNHYQQHAEKQVQEALPNPQENLELKELENYLGSALQDLPERQRNIFCMNRYEGKTYTEIAASLSLSVKTVEAEMSKALKFLKKDIKNYR